MSFIPRPTSPTNAHTSINPQSPGCGPENQKNDELPESDIRDDLNVIATSDELCSSGSKEKTSFPEPSNQEETAAKFMSPFIQTHSIHFRDRSTEARCAHA